MQFLYCVPIEEMQKIVITLCEAGGFNGAGDASLRFLYIALDQDLVCFWEHHMLITAFKL